MTLRLFDCSFFGSALPEPFIKYEVEGVLNKLSLLPKITGEEGNHLQNRWEVIRRKLRGLGGSGGSIRVANHIFEPLCTLLEYDSMAQEEKVQTREGEEEGGWLMKTADESKKLRCWAVEAGTDLDAPNRRGRAFRFSPTQVVWRVLQAKGERIGLLTDGEELRILIAEASRAESFILIRLNQSGGWRSFRDVPDSLRLLIGLASSKALPHISDTLEKARLSQTRVTKELRNQAKLAVARFVQELLSHPENREKVSGSGWEVPSGDSQDKNKLAKNLWREGLILVYRLLFIFTLESSHDPARRFSFASSSLWRNTYSPNIALGLMFER